MPRVLTADGPKWGLGGVCDENNQFAEVSFYDGGWAKHGGYYEWKEEEYCDEEAVYMGLFLSHWGHFLVDLTGRMWFLQQLAKTRTDFKVAYVGEETIQGNNLAFLKLLGIREEQLIHITKPTRFRKVYVPEQAFRTCLWYTDEFVNMLDEMHETVMNSAVDFSKLETVKKVYFTRKKFSKATTSEFGEDYFESCFIHNGYEAIAPETLSLEEQIYIWNHAEEIACMNGTIPLNVLFSKNSNLKLTVLNKTSICHENPGLLLEMRKISATFLDVYKEPFKNYPKSLGTGPYLLWPSDQFDDFCKKKGYTMPITTNARAWYFRKQYVRYCWSILAVKRRVYHLISKLVPEKIKGVLRNGSYN